jgi:hypothetical protein
MEPSLGAANGLVHSSGVMPGKLTPSGRSEQSAPAHGPPARRFVQFFDQVVGQRDHNFGHTYIISRSIAQDRIGEVEYID